jgi:nucleoside-diphosphate-sugar epimerase
MGPDSFDREQQESISMARAFVTGANGFLGQHLTQQLVADGWQVRGLCRASSDPGILSDLDIDLVDGDITDAESIRRALDSPFEAVFHVAADTSTWRGDRERQTRINVEGTRNVLTAFVASRSARFVHTSSIAVWGLQAGTLTEKTPRDASVLSVNYSRTKSQAENLVQSGIAQGMDGVLLNPAHIMGPLDRHNWVRLIQMIATDSLPGIAPGAGSFADVRQVARAHIVAVEKARAGENYLLGGESRSFAEVVSQIAQQLKIQVRARQVPAPMLKTVARIKDWWSHIDGQRPDITPDEAAFVCARQLCDSSKAINELDYRVTPFEELLTDTIEWARSKDMI